MPDLITQSRAAQNSALAQLAVSGPAYLASLISAAGDAIRRATGRDFALGSYTEYHNGGIYIREPLRLRQFPVVQITRVAASPRGALLVQNIDAVTNQRATVETTSSGLRLVRVASAVATTLDLLYTDHPTIASTASAINAIGSGWSATIRDGFDRWPTADLRPLQGAMSVLNDWRDLEIYTESIGQLAGLPFMPNGSDEASSAIGWRLDDETGELYGRLPRGWLNIRIDYRAGFATIPQAVQEACVQLAADLYQAGLVNNSLKKATLGASSVELKDSTSTPQLSAKVRLLLAPYVDYARVIFR
ncbi:MAG TPA: hypothetical protein VH370_14195 [Humisphaera sp.]|jgi:hypothetical protein|nr:hypothetical protein [Humisphaera sp.]